MSPDDGPRLLADRYELHEVLGRGGAGEVWRATDRRLGRAVALKSIRIPPGLDHDEVERTRERVLREARTTGRLQHPGTVAMYDVVEDDGMLHLVMELVEGPSLAQRIRDDGPMDPDEVARIGLDLLGALRAAHRAGLVHRDVKPSNVLLQDGIRPRLTDFGTALVVGADRLTATGLVIGSPAYMSPEQAKGEETGPATDLWSLGATLYHAVEGRPPFRGDTPMATMGAVAHGTPRPHERAGALGPALDALLVADPALRADGSRTEALLRAAADPAAPVDPTDPTTPRERTAVLPASGPAAEPPAAAPRDRPAPALAGRGRRGSGLLIAGAVALVVAAGTIAVASTLGGEDDPVDDVASPQAAAPAPTPTPTPTPTAEPTATPTPTDPATPPGQGGTPPGQGGTPPGQADREDDDEDEDDGDRDDAQALSPSVEVPADWVTYAPDDAPYTVAHPPGWQIQPRSGTITDIRDPETGTYLRLDWTDTPAEDPLADWEAYEPQFADGKQEYRRLRMDGGTYQGNPAALWEYTYVEGGQTLHAYNLNGTDGTYGYALNFQSSEAGWADAQPLFLAFAESYRIG